MADLITEERTWDEKTVRDVFESEDANAILQIPLSRVPMSYKLLWTNSPDGSLTAKNAYVTTRRLLRNKISNRAQRNPKWKVVWSSNILPKVKLFILRMIHGLLPTVLNLRKRNMKVEGVCSICGNLGESAFHVFYECPFAKKV